LLLLHSPRVEFFYSLSPVTDRFGGVELPWLHSQPLRQIIQAGGRADREIRPPASRTTLLRST
jgi:hypothetical protein